MFKTHPLTRLIASCCLGIFFAQAEATIVRMDFDFGAGTVTDQVYIELFDSKAPGTVANFLNYVEDATGRRYDTTFIHRSDAGFIVQGGGLTFDENVSNFFTEQATALDRLDPPIQNEFDPSDPERSNIRGTIAMAKVGGNPDSATSGWFYNLSDNAGLDTQNGGFTVFARVLCDSTPAPVNGCDNMDIMDKFTKAGENLLSIEALAPFPLDTVPLVNYTTGTTVADINLIRLRNVEVLDLIQPSALDFGFVQIGITQNQTITVENQTDFTFTIQSVGANILPPFSILSEDCSNKLLGTVTDPLASRTCSITVNYQPTQVGDDSSSFRIKTDHVKLPSLTVWVSGSGVPPQAPTISFTPALGPDLELGNLLPGSTERSFDLQISNLGVEFLAVSPQPFTGIGTDNLSLNNGCTIPLATGDSCTVSITFSAITPGIATDAQLEITTNDPTTPVATIRITGSSNSDSDGVPDIIEAAVSSTGDGNGDGIADILQDNVTSLPTILGDYVTLETEVGIFLENVQAIENPAPDSTPRLENGTVAFNHGFFSFALDNVPVGGTASVTLYLPEGQTVSNYFKFGLLPSDIVSRLPFLITNPPHWYSFRYNGETGAQINGNRITLFYKDGGRGDDDLTQNGRITDPGGPAIITLSNSSSGGGGGGGCSLQQTTNSRQLFPLDFVLLLFMLFTLRRIRQHRMFH